MSRWASVRLADIAAQGQYGLNAAAMKEGKGVRFIRITDIDDQGELRSDGAAYVPSSTENLAAYYLIPGDLVIARSGATAGKSLLFKGLDELAVFAGYLIRFKLDTSKALPEFVGYYFKSKTYWNYINTTKRAAAQPNINAKELASLPIPLPPLPEQNRIVDLLSRAEGIVQLRREAEKKTAELIPALFIDMFGDPATNPKGWSVMSLGDITTVKGGGTPSKSNPNYWVGNIPWVSPKDMGRVEVISDATDHISEDALQNSATNLIPAGSILIVTRSGVLKHSVPCAVSGCNVSINQDIKAFIPKPDIHPTFLLAHLRHKTNEILGLVRIGATVHNVETETLKRLKFIVPSLEIQKQFAEKVEQVRSIQYQQLNATTKAQAAFEALMDHSFSSEVKTA